MNQLELVAKRSEEEHKAVHQANQEFQGGKSRVNDSYTDTHVTLGGVPIFIDEDCRQEVVPRGTIQVNNLFRGLERIDK